MRHLAILVAILVCAPVAADCRAGVVTAFDLSSNGGASPSVSVAAQPGPAGVTSSALTRSAGLVGNDGFGTFGATNWPTSSIPGNAYFTFTITPDAGTTLDLTRLSFGEKRKALGPMGFQVRSSRDNFAAPLTADTVTAYPDTSFNSTRQQTYTLSPTQFSGLTGAVTFRIYAYATLTTGVQGVWSISNYNGQYGGEYGGVIVEGTATSIAAVPEAPAWLGVGAAALAALVITPRKAARE